jgi:hypothetical protein
MAENTDFSEIIAEKNTNGIRLVPDRPKVADGFVTEADKGAEAGRHAEEHRGIRDREHQVDFLALLYRKAYLLHLGYRRRAGNREEITQKHGNSLAIKKLILLSI